jgi:hypothetical protein
MSGMLGCFAGSAAHCVHTVGYLYKASCGGTDGTHAGKFQVRRLRKGGYKRKPPLPIEKWERGVPCLEHQQADEAEAIAEDEQDTA